MKIKVCGMKYPDNIQALATLPIDFMGLIFYKRSPRFFDGEGMKDFPSLPDRIRLTGVFVDEKETEMLRLAKLWKLKAVQLHGQESPALCRSIRSTGLEVIKAFSVSDLKDLEKTAEYEGCCDYFLFDTKTEKYGGSGNQYDWSILKEYRGSAPFFLSGGIQSGDENRIRQIKHPSFHGIDLNSRFELAPGLKNILQIHEFIDTINIAL